MFGILDEKEIDDFLHHNIIARIGCCYNDSVYIVPVSYAYDNNCAIVHTTEGMKIDLMRANPFVCFEVDNIENMGNWKSVIAWGNFQELTDPVVRKNAIRKLYRRVFPAVVSEKVKLHSRWPFEPDDNEVIKGVVFNICLHKKSGRFEQSDTVTF